MGKQKNTHRVSICPGGDPGGRAYFATQNTIPQGVASEKPQCKHCFIFSRLLLRGEPKGSSPFGTPLKDKQKIPYGHFQFILW